MIGPAFPDDGDLVLAVGDEAGVLPRGSSSPFRSDDRGNGVGADTAAVPGTPDSAFGLFFWSPRAPLTPEAVLLNAVPFSGPREELGFALDGAVDGRGAPDPATRFERGEMVVAGTAAGAVVGETTFFGAVPSRGWGEVLASGSRSTRQPYQRSPTRSKPTRPNPASGRRRPESRTRPGLALPI